MLAEVEESKVTYRGNQPKSGKKKAKPATAAARQMFIYGEGDGVRVLEVKELAEKAGVSEQTIREHLPHWQDEVEENLRKDSKLGSTTTLSLPDETLEKHKLDTEFIRKRLDEVSAEIEALTPIISNLERIVDQISQISEDGDKVIALFDRYLRLCMNRKSLIKLFTDLKRLWDEKVGLDSLKAVQEAVAKSVGVAQAKSSEPSVETNAVKVVHGVFKMKG